MVLAGNLGRLAALSEKQATLPLFQRILAAVKPGQSADIAGIHPGRPTPVRNRLLNQDTDIFGELGSMVRYGIPHSPADPMSQLRNGAIGLVPGSVKTSPVPGEVR